MPDELIMIDDWVAELSEEAHQIVVQRACIDLGWSVTLKPEGGMFIDGDIESDEFYDACEERYKHMYAAELLNDLVADGLIEPDGVDEDGEIRYTAVD